MPGAWVKLAGNCFIPVISLVRAGKSVCESTRLFSDKQVFRKRVCEECDLRSYGLCRV